MKVTIYDVAREAGLSIATVSRVINGKGGVTPKSEGKIRAAIERLGYIPDASAQGLASSLVNTIGVAIAGVQISGRYCVQFLSGAERAARERGFDLLLTSTFGTPEEFVRTVRTRHKMDGLIFPSVSEYEEALYAADFPVVYAGHRQPWDEKRLHVYGGFSGYRKEALELLASKGCRKILFLEGNLVKIADKNHRIIKDFMTASGFSPDQIEYVDGNDQPDRDFWRKIEERLSSDDPPDGLFIADDQYCPQVYTLAARYARSIPEDLKVVSVIQDPADGVLLRPALTSFLVHSYQMGYNAAVKLIQFIQGEPVDDMLTYVPYSLIERESV